MIDVNTISLH